MAGDVLKVHFGEMANVPGHIDSAIKQLNTVIEDLERAAAPIVASWEGDAQEAYRTRQKLWQDAQNDLNLLLGQVKMAVQRSLERYRETETRNAQLFGG